LLQVGEVVVYPVHPVVPGLLVSGQPVVQRAQARGFEAVEAVAPVGPAADQPYLAEHAQVLGDLGLGHRQAGHDVPDCLLAGDERVEDLAVADLGDGILAALFITVRKVARSRDFYSRVLGGTVIMEENPCTVRLSNSWIIMNPGGPPTPDKPDISVVDYQPGNITSIFLNLRVADIHACYQEWKAKGAEFVTPPIDRGASHHQPTSGGAKGLQIRGSVRAVQVIRQGRRR
jgi:hypothetical protein